MLPQTRFLKKLLLSISILNLLIKFTSVTTQNKIKQCGQAANSPVKEAIPDYDRLNKQLVIQKMDNKIKMLRFLKNDKLTNFQSEHVLAALLDNAVSFIEVRRFLHSKYPGTQMVWAEVEDQDLMILAKEAGTYIRINLQEWKQQYQRYLSEKDELKERRQKLSAVLSINSALNNVQMKQVLKNVVQERRDLVNLHKNSQKIAQIEAENRQITQLLQLLDRQIEYECKNESFWSQSDEQMSIRVRELGDKFHLKLQQQKSVQEQVQRKMVQKALQEYNRKLLVMKKRLYQIFLYYCRQNNLSHLTFEEYNKSMRQIDLRLFLKYFKDYKFTQFNKYRFKVNAVTLLFRAQASNGLSLSFQQFWNIHKQLFQMRDLMIVHLDILSAHHSKLEEFKLNIEQQIHKFQQFNEVVNEAITKQILQFNNLRNLSTQANPQSTIKKSQSSVILRKKAFKEGNSQNLSKKTAKMESSSVSSIYYQKSSLSSKGLFQVKKRPNLIQQSRKVILNEEQSNLVNSIVNSNIKRSDSLWSQNSQLKRSKIQDSLPKILKLSNEEISGQGIYKSLKHFANFDYIAQEKKLKQLIGVSRGEDNKYLEVYLKKQMQEKEQKKREKSEEREERRKKIIEVIAQKQHHHCKRYHPQEVQPYMRF